MNNFHVYKMLLEKSYKTILTNENKSAHNDFGLRTSDFGLRTSDFGLRTSDFGLRTRANYCLKSEYNTSALCENKGHILHKALNKELHRAKPPPLSME